MSLPPTSVLIQVAIGGLLTGGVYALLVSGLTLIFGVMRVINIAHGAFLVLSAYLAYWLFTLLGMDPIVSIAVLAPLFFVLGVLVQRYLIARVRQEPGLLVLVTFALAITLEGVMGSLWRTTGRSVRTAYTGEVVPLALGDLTVRLPIVQLVGFAAAVIALGVLYLLLTRSDLGRAIRATIQNPDAAQLVGVNVALVRALTFGAALASVAAGGAVFSLIWTFNAGSHEAWISKMLSIVVLGGMGSLPGALVGALIIGVAEAVAAVTITTYLSPIVSYLILFFILVFRPQGLLGSRIRVAYPWIWRAPYFHLLGFDTLLGATMAVSWNIMGGYTGYKSLGHSAFFGLGAYLVAIAANRWGWNPLWSAPVLALVVVAVALLLGWIMLRTTGSAFVIATIALLLIFRLLALNLRGITGGAPGLSQPLPPWSPEFSRLPFFYYMLVWTLVAVAVSAFIVRSRFGLGLLAIRDDEGKAEMVGVNTTLYKVLAFGLSAYFVGLGGGIWSYFQTHISPVFAFDLRIGVDMILMTMLGGLGTVWGPVLGAFS